MSSIRIQRFEKELTKIFSNTLNNRIRNKNLQWITISDLKLSADLRYVKAYFTHLSDKSHEFLEKELNRSAGVFKDEIAKAKLMRTIPEIVFHYDDLTEKANRLEKLFKQIHEEEEDLTDADK